MLENKWLTGVIFKPTLYVVGAHLLSHPDLLRVGFFVKSWTMIRQSISWNPYLTAWEVWSILTSYINPATVANFISQSGCPTVRPPCCAMTFLFPGDFRILAQTFPKLTACPLKAVIIIKTSFRGPCSLQYQKGRCTGCKLKYAPSTSRMRSIMKLRHSSPSIYNSEIKWIQHDRICGALIRVTSPGHQQWRVSCIGLTMLNDNIIDINRSWYFINLDILCFFISFQNPSGILC